jgi:CRISPR-associated protein Cmr3
METYLTITPHDPIIARDGRPFGIGQRRMRSLTWPYPSVLAGSLRTIIGKQIGTDFKEAVIVRALKNISVSGPLPLWSDKLFFPAPKDILVRDDGDRRQAYALRPKKMKKMSEDNGREGCDLPKGNLLPTLLPMNVQDFKRAAVPYFWSAEMMTKWLIDPLGKDFEAPPDPEKADSGTNFLPSPQKDSRVHVQISPELGSSDEGMLFMTVGLDLTHKATPKGIQLAARFDATGIFENKVEIVDLFGTFGGERRLALWKTEATEMMQKIWSFPEEIRQALDDQKKRTSKQRIRMVLATPAVFSRGWLPGWLKIEEDLIVGTPPLDDPAGLKLRLISASIDRWKPISGWSLECRPRPGPKPIRRLVPAGAVYFFEVLAGDGSALAERLWLRSVSDKEPDGQDWRDGFGLALWGVWDFFDDDHRKDKKIGV